MCVEVGVTAAARGGRGCELPREEGETLVDPPLVVVGLSISAMEGPRDRIGDESSCGTPPTPPVLKLRPPPPLLLLLLADMIPLRLILWFMLRLGPVSLCAAIDED